MDAQTKGQRGKNLENVRRSARPYRRILIPGSCPRQPQRPPPKSKLSPLPNSSALPPSQASQRRPLSEPEGSRPEGMGGEGGGRTSPWRLEGAP